MIGIKEASEKLEVPQYVLRFWETQFKQIRPLKKNGRRIYRDSDIQKLQTIKNLLHVKKYTIEGAKQYLMDQKIKRIGTPQEKIEEALYHLKEANKRIKQRLEKE